MSGQWRRFAAAAMVAGSVVAAGVAVDASARSLVPAPGMLPGSVWLDRNGNGQRDEGEPGLQGIKVSNGRELAITNADGDYALPLHVGDTLFVIKPPGLAPALRDDGLPDVWRHHIPQGSPRLRYDGIAPTTLERADFALRPATADRGGRLEVLVFGDPQVTTAREVGYFERDIVAPLRNAPGATLGLTLGDVANDTLSLYPDLKRVMAQLRMPWLHLPGNHDLDMDASRDEDSLLSYRAAFGPDTWAWEEPEASFVMLDDVVVQPGQSPAYIGGLREDQFAFLEAWLATLPRERMLVLAVHIPLHDPAGRETFRRADRERLFALLQPFPRVLLLSAHAHAQRHHFHDADDGWHGAQPLHEYVVGAACGGFWSGAPDAEGIPDARMSDGTPNGYARLRITADDYHLRWYAARDPDDTRIALHAPRVLRKGAYPAFALTANVYMGLPDTRVEFRVDGGDWQPMRRVERADPALVAINADDDRRETLAPYERSVEAGISQHLWRAALPTHLDVGEHEVEVRAFDRWDGELHARTHYRLEAPAWAE